MNTQVVGLTMPPEFPSDEWLNFQADAARVSDGNPEVHRLVAGGWSGLAHRYVAMERFYLTFRASLVKFPNGFPDHPARHLQETDIFGFTSFAVSSVECGFFSLNALSHLTWPDRFSVESTRLGKINPDIVCSLMRSVAELEPFVSPLKKAITGSEYITIKNLRNQLTHRSVPSRLGFVSVGSAPKSSRPAEGMGMFSGIVLSPEYFDPLRNGIGEAVREIVATCSQIVRVAVVNKSD